MARKPLRGISGRRLAPLALLLAAAATLAVAAPALAPKRPAAASMGVAPALPARARTPEVARRDARPRPRARGEVVPSRARIASARRYLGTRAGQTAFAVIDSRGRLSGLRSADQFGSASMVKAMLLVAYLDSLDRAGAALSEADRALLGAMVRRSDNGAATAIYARVGDAGLARLARRARMRRFAVAGYWANARITAADQARFFLRLEPLLPARHRAYGRALLSGVVREQSWGIPRAARPRWRVMFKGGWRPEPAGKLVHQAARLERGDRVLAIAVLTRANPSHGYGTETIRGVAARLLRER